MSFINTYFNGLLHLLYPVTCLGCGSDLVQHHQSLCANCVDQLPLTHFHLHKDNPVEKIFRGRLRIQHACAFTYFTKSSVMQRLLHQLKYAGKKELGVLFGQMIGDSLKSSNYYRGLQVIVPLPLHAARLRKRGYNQSAMIAQGIGERMNVPVAEDIIVRKKHTSTQTQKNRVERWENIEGKFLVRDQQQLAGRHVLLVDDVITTGATLDACGNEMLKIPGLQLSITALAYASR